jgi:CRISPR-associated protein Cmr2
MAFDGALAAASPSPAFLALRVGPWEEFLQQAVHLVDLGSSTALLAKLMWQAMLPVVEELGPDAILTPSLRYHPTVDAWLAEQGVQAGAKDELGAEHAPTLPSEFVALVPADRAAELGRACEQRFRDAWSQLATSVRVHVAKAGWCSDQDAVWGDIWERQIRAAWNPTWVAVAWGEDSTGAGGLVLKHEVTVLEKWARVHEDAAGLEDAWPGIYYGLWQGAAQAASVCRQRAVGLSVVREPKARCAVCAEREALHGEVETSVDGGVASVRQFWDAITADGGAAHGHVAAGEMLCAVCAVRRLAPALPPEDAPFVLSSSLREAGVLSHETDLLALVLMVPDNHAALVRGGKDLKQGATLADCVHSAVGKHLTRARSHLREILDTSPPLGPSRNASLCEAFRNFAVDSAHKLLAEHGAIPLLLTDDAVLAVAPAARTLELARALRARFREPMAELELPHGARRLAIHPGPSATTSAVIAFTRAGERAGSVLRDCRALLEQVARDGLGGDALVMRLRARSGDERLYAAHWDNLAGAIDAVVRLMPEQADRVRLVKQIRSLEPALGNPDLDKPALQARPLLVRAQLSASALLGKLHGDDEQALAQAVCSVVDQGVALSDDTDRNRALDGLHIAIHLAGGTR